MKKNRKRTKAYKVILTVLLSVFVLMQFITPQRNLSPVPAGQVFVDSFKVDAKVNAILSVSCYDCHSNNTQYPWYTNVQPLGWFMDKHIKDGKEKLNFDELPSYGSRRLNSKFTQITKQIEQDKMPLNSYLWMHEGARLSMEDKRLLVDYFNSLTDNE
ncbi:heme-binding domain-containing protein [Avrilella dinanensis]|uniref:heme-binding domain-containing protein n=1 Tax=Avrilella dinanensis TaxID=2008672 RepID=UPI00240A123B|nr:heme-binding domain-containing protein [Avrilella dinanensis]